MQSRRGRGHQGSRGRGGGSGSAGSGSWSIFNSFNDRKSGRSAYGKSSDAEKATAEKFAPQFSSDADASRPADEALRLANAVTSTILVRIEGDSGTSAVSLPAFHSQLLQRSREDLAPAASATLEYLRCVAMKELMREYEELLSAANWPMMKRKGQREAFIRWVFERKALERAWDAGQTKSGVAAGDLPPRDPVIPGSPVEVSTSLLREVEADAPMEDAEEKAGASSKIVLEVAQRSNAKLLHIANSEIPKLKGDAICNDKFTVFWHKDTATFAKIGSDGSSTSHEMLIRHANRLKYLFNAFSLQGVPDTEKVSSTPVVVDEAAFAARTFAMLERYRAITGVKPNEGSGHHAAIPPQIHACLERNLEVSMELFAAPFNSHGPNYCSLFGDTDCHFGSVGSFFDFHPVQGSFEANPPFVEEVMEEMRLHMEQLLAATDQPLSFTIVVPAWTNPVPPSHQALTENKSGYLRRKILFPADDHVYLDGFQHTLRDAPFKPVHETVVFIIQNEAGAVKWPATDAVEADLRATWKELATTVVRPVLGGPIAPSSVDGPIPGEKRPRDTDAEQE